MAALGPHCCVRAFSSCGEWGLLFIAMHKLSYSKVFWIFLDQGLNPRPLHWQAGFKLLDHQGSFSMSDSFVIPCTEARQAPLIMGFLG